MAYEVRLSLPAVVDLNAGNGPMSLGEALARADGARRVRAGPGSLGPGSLRAGRLDR